MQRCDEWLEQYYGRVTCAEFTLLNRAVRTLLGNILTAPDDKPLPWHPYRGITPSHFGFRGIWNWDTAFHAVGVSRWDPELAREQILMFLSYQMDGGALPDVIRENGSIVDDFGKPPVMPWAAMRVDQADPSTDFAEKVYLAFVTYEGFWMKHRGGLANGLLNYDSRNPDPKTRLQGACFESGWDNAVRWDGGIYDVWPVDLNCFMVMLYRAMADFAEKLGLTDDVERWHAREQAFAALVEERLWSDSDGAYLDYDFGKQEFVQALSPASFMPLYIGTASPERATAMADIAASTSKFNPGWPTVAYDHPEFDPHGYWRGRTWLNVAYFALKGLKDYGYDQIADAGRDTLLQWVADNPDFICENYHPYTGKAVGVRNFSWSAVFVLEFILNWE